MHTIEIDFDVFKGLTSKRQSEEHTFNEVLRDMLGLPPKPKSSAKEKKPWISQGVIFPHGTEFRGTRKGKTSVAHIDDGRFIFNGKSYAGFSPAAEDACDTPSENGWLFWTCKRPNDPEFVSVNVLRKK